MPDLLSEITTAFRGVVRPAVMLHDECYDDMDIEAFYEFESWQEIPETLIERENAALCFASAEAFQFLIPAYMCFALTHLGTGSFTVDSTIYALCPDKKSDAFQRSKYVTLTTPQRLTIRHFLEFMFGQGQAVDVHAAPAAISTIWLHSRPDETPLA